MQKNFWKNLEVRKGCGLHHLLSLGGRVQDGKRQRGKNYFVFFLNPQCILFWNELYDFFFIFEILSNV